MVRNEVQRFNGLTVEDTGDGFLPTFDGLRRAIGCAWEIIEAAKGLGIEVRPGVHTGECLVGPKDVNGIAIHAASRVVDEATAGEVLVSGNAKDLVYGSGTSFEDRGGRELKGTEETTRLFSVTSTG